MQNLNRRAGLRIPATGASDFRLIQIDWRGGKVLTAVKALLGDGKSGFPDPGGDENVSTRETA